MSLSQQMKNDLKRSHLHTKTIIDALGFAPLDAQESKLLTGSPRPGYVIPYFHLNGQMDQHFRVRFLDDLTPRYWQEKGSDPKVYFPPLPKKLRRTWSDVAGDCTTPIVITEGEKKAASATYKGLPCIGLGGVWCWRSKKKSLALVPELRGIDWQNRHVKLIFDNDIMQKAEVQSALDALASTLTTLGADVETAYIPFENEKQGLDDYLLTHTVEDIDNLETKAHPLGELLQDINEEIAVLQQQGRIILLRSNTIFSNSQNVKITYGNRTYTTTEGKRILLIDEWLKWENRRQHDDLVYAPGEERVTKANNLNTWQGYGIAPSKGSANILIDFINEILEEEYLVHWFLQWLAYPLQHPGTKLFTGVVMWSREHGTGKSFIGQLMLDIYGKNGIEITQADLHGGFNDWLAEKQFVLGEEVSASNRRKDADILKNILTSENVRVNKKYVPNYVVPNYANFMFNSNHPDAVMLDPEDRRYAVLEIMKKKPLKFFQRLNKWRRTQKGSSRLFQFLLDYNLKGFDPNAPAPNSKAKSVMIMANMSGLDRWAYDLMLDPDAVFGSFASKMKRDLFKVSELANHVPDDLKNSYLPAIGKALLRAGATSFGKTIRLGKNKGIARLIAIRNIEYWRKENDPKKWAEHYTARR